MVPARLVVAAESCRLWQLNCMFIIQRSTHLAKQPHVYTHHRPCRRVAFAMVSMHVTAFVVVCLAINDGVWPASRDELALVRNRFATKNSYNASQELWMAGQSIEFESRKIEDCCQPTQVTYNLQVAK